MSWYKVEHGTVTTSAGSSHPDVLGIRVDILGELESILDVDETFVTDGSRGPIVHDDVVPGVEIASAVGNEYEVGVLPRIVGSRGAREPCDAGKASL